MSSEVSAVEKVLQVYFDGLYEGDTKKLGEVFHHARISMPRPVTARPATGRVASGSRWWKAGRPVRPRQRTRRPNRVDRLLRPGTAIARSNANCRALLHRLSDAAEVDGRWQIISKTFHTVTKETCLRLPVYGGIQEGQPQVGCR